jgi:ring-1,2-phenylacetyl-CoA epoxidase subunit PaaC
MSDGLEFCLRVGDDALIAAQRLSEWSTRAPDMEEDIALSNIALDQLGVARLLLSYAGELEGAGRDEDALAYRRDDAQFRNCLLAELPNGDFAVSMAKLLFLSAYQWLLYGQLTTSEDEYLSGVAAKARKESEYHLDHAAQWTIRLGDGTDESHRRMQAAVNEIWPYTHELFQDDALTQRLASSAIAPLPSQLYPQWTDRIDAVLAYATLARPADGWAPCGGRDGRHTEHLSYLLGEMQVLHRAHPGARW